LRDLRFGVSVAVIGQVQTMPGASINGSDLRRNPGMTSAGSSLSFGAFATADAGSEYLATAEHYRSLARSVVDALRRACLVLVTGDPPASLPMLTAALRKAAAPRAVIELSCGPDLDCEKLLRDGWTRADTPAPGVVGEESGRSVPTSPILVFADADRLSKEQIEKFREAAQAMPPERDRFEACVLLAGADFLSRPESAGPHLLDEGLAAHLRVQQLERDEIEAFIRHQLPPDERAERFTAQRVALIALTSGGEPAVVNRLARRMLEFEPDVSSGGLPAKLLQGWRRHVRKSSGNKSIAQPDAITGDDKITPPRATPRRYAVLLSLLAGIIICLGAAWLGAGAFESQHLGVLVDFVRDRILPRNEQAEPPAAAEAAISPVTAAGSSSREAAATSPSAASADETAPEPVATSAGHPGATSPPRLASRPAPQPVADEQRLSAGEIAALVARGDAFLGAGDIASARLFFERAADLGDGRAAMRMAVTYDAEFLDRAGLHGLRGDPEQAALWYRRARELGKGKAELPLGSPGTSGSAERQR
jgi:hypothetical protein